MSENQIPHISGALTAPPASEGPVDHNVPQPRQPTSLQGLLRFAMDTRDSSSSAPSDAQLLPIDEERKKFLDDALKSMTKNVIEMLNKSVTTLKNADKLNPDSDVTIYLKAFDKILEHIDVIDTAIDFHKIGGFAIFPPCLNSDHPQIRAGACDVIAELCQNNPYCQRIVSETDLLEQLLMILDHDINESVQIKALYAISCTVRENISSAETFMRLGGLQIICRALQKPSDKLRTKAAFLLSRLAMNKETRDELVADGLIPILVQLISEPRRSSHEHLISLLWLLILDNPQALDVCTQPELRLTKVLKNHLAAVKHKEEMIEEAQHCEDILNAICSVLPDPPETDR